MVKVPEVSSLWLLILLLLNRRSASEYSGPFKSELSHLFGGGNRTSFSQIWDVGKQWLPHLLPLALSQRPLPPQLVTFQTRDNNQLTLDLNFNFPFLAVPISNSTNILNLAKDFMRRERPLINIDVQAITIVSIMVMAALLFSVTFRTFFAPFEHPNVPRNRSIRDETEDELWDLLRTLSSALKKYGIDSGACAKRIVCVYVKNAVRAKREWKGRPSHWNRILDGLSRSDWALEYVEGTGVDQAVQVGRSERSCEHVFKHCNPNMWLNRGQA